MQPTTSPRLALALGLAAVALTAAPSARALTVAEAVSAGCSTKQVEALSLQIIAQGNCVAPGAYVGLAASPNVTLGAAVLPYLEEPARDALALALSENPSLGMTVNSMLRTVAQQYLLYRWYQLSQCGIGLAATPGGSNHETGLAIDIQQYDAWRTILQGHDFAWLGSSDPVHFDYAGPDAVDHKGVDVLAFQQLWNANNTADLITEDGVWGPETQSRLELSPAEGFAIGATCTPNPPPPAGSAVLSGRWVGAADAFSDGPSAGVTDLLQGRDYPLEIDAHGDGQGDLADVLLSVTLPDALIAAGWSLLGSTGGAFTPLSPPAGNPPESGPLPASITLEIGTIAAGETRRVRLVVRAASYSVTDVDPLAVEVQSGQSTLSVEADVYSDRRWQWDGERLEGWTAAGPSAAASIEPAEGTLALLATEGALVADSPAIAVPVSEVEGIELGASRLGPDGEQAALLITTTAGQGGTGGGGGGDGTASSGAGGGAGDDGGSPTVVAIPFELPADGQIHHLRLPSDALDRAAVVTGLRLQLWSEVAGAEATSGAVDYLRLGPAAHFPIAGDNGGCACRAAPGGPAGSTPRWPLLGGVALLLCRRRARERASRGRQAWPTA